MQSIFEEFLSWLKINWEYIVDFVNLLISLLTLLIAFKIFNRFSFKNRVLEKQFESVSDLINILQNWTISIHAKGIEKEEDYFSTGWRVKFFDFKDLNKMDSFKGLFFEENILFTQEWFEHNPLIGLDNNPFLPKSISKKIEPFKIWLPTRANPQFYKKVIYINLDEFDTSVRRYSDLGLICNPREKCFKNFETFNEMCNDLIVEIENWLKKYDAGDIHLK
ncbi:hypothetical protein [Flavobacterium pedocola]